MQARDPQGTNKHTKNRPQSSGTVFCICEEGENLT